MTLELEIRLDFEPRYVDISMPGTPAIASAEPFI